MIAPARPFHLTREADRIVVDPSARGPWGNTIAGRLLGALLASALDDYLAEQPGFACTRLTVELFKPAMMADLVVPPPRIIRAGNRIQVLELSVDQGGASVAQAKAVLLRRGEQPAGPFHPPPAWAEPTPLTGMPLRTESRYADKFDSWTPARSASIGDGVWLREKYDLFEGEPLSPLVRCALAADWASPVGNDNGGTISFINADYTLYLGRQPEGDLLGIQPHGQVSADGVSVAQCVLHDIQGPVGYIAATALANSIERANKSATV